MSIPLDRLYQYIHNQARQIWQSNVIIYRFFPHGSKDLKNLSLLDNNYVLEDLVLSPHLYCNDQEPLDWEKYQKVTNQSQVIAEMCHHNGYPKQNFRDYPLDIWDWALLLHSEQGGHNLSQYQQDGFITVYYWSHAIIALDWFRYARKISQHKQIQKTFLIYNRAWSGTREYRLKLIDSLIDQDLLEHCRTWVNNVDVDLGIHYQDHKFKNPQWRPRHTLENFLLPSTSTSASSADFDLEDYLATKIEVVLETLFDDDRVHLTEKILRPIALGQPFILVGPAHSLQYLKHYGFKTFDTVWSEEYDQIQCAQQRLNCVVDVMKQIVAWSPEQQQHAMTQAQAIADYNKKRFFSADFELEILNELDSNMQMAFDQLRTQNTSSRWFFGYNMLQNMTAQHLNSIDQSLTELNKQKYLNHFADQNQWPLFYLEAKKHSNSQTEPN